MKKKENMMKRKEATPNAFEDSFSLSFNIKALITPKPQLALNPLLIYCKLLFCCCPEHYIQYLLYSMLFMVTLVVVVFFFSLSH